MTRSAVATENVKLAVYEALVDAAHDALFSLDASMRVELWNRNAERVFGRHSEGVVGEPADRLFPTHVRSLLDRVLGGERVDHVETEIERKDGMPVAIALSLHPVRDATGSCCGIVGVARDVTEQRLAQAALAETEARLREAEGLAHAGRWLWDVGSGAVQWSEELHRIHGIDPAHFDGTLDAHLRAVHPDDVAAVRATLMTAVESGLPFDAQYRIVRGDGRERTLYARAEPSLGSTGAAVGLRGFAQDVTERDQRVTDP